MKHLVSWACEQDTAAETTATTSSSNSRGIICRLQQVVQLPLNAQEEGVLLEVLRGRAQGGLPGGEMLPLYFLQVGGARYYLWDCLGACCRGEGEAQV